MKTWHLENVREIAKENPYTFYVPSDELIGLLKVGHLVKLMFINDAPNETDKASGERMWVKITHIDGKNFIGQLDNQPYEIQNLNMGDEIYFDDYHIMDYDSEFNEISDPVPALDKYWDKCWTTKNIVDKKAPIGYIYRTEPYKDGDSGWQIFSGNESDEFINTPENIKYVALGVLLNIDDSFIDLLSADIGKAFAKNEQGEWVEEEFYLNDN